MDYAEWAPPPEMQGWIKTGWTLRANADPGVWLENVATPDGSIEIVRRTSGRSEWRRLQPCVFVAGLIDRPARFRMTGDASFSAIRLWPWTWHALGGRRCSGFMNDWIPLADGTALHDLSVGLGEEQPLNPRIGAALEAVPNRHRLHRIGQVILQSTSVAEVRDRLECSSRWLQRWSAAHIGMPLRTYLRLLRFQEALVTVQSSPDTLAQCAAATGFADQAHMARTFREMAGDPAIAVRTRAAGPFLS